MAGMCRREVLLPGDFLPEPSPGRHHGVITRVMYSGGSQVACVTMTDFKKMKLQLPLGAIQQWLLPKQGTKRSRDTGSDRGCDKGGDGRSFAWYDKPVAVERTRRPAGIPLHGPGLSDYMGQLSQVESVLHPPGTQLWVRIIGGGRVQHPGVAWRFDLCKRLDMGDLILSYRPGLVLVRFYGEHSSMWVRPEDCELSPDEQGELVRQLKAWGRQEHKQRLVELALNEMAGTHADPGAECRRMLELYEQYLGVRAALDNCYLCREMGARLECCACERTFHPLCLRSPATCEEELPGGGWVCPCCGEDQKVGEHQDDDSGGSGDKVERMGLTPDWIIEAAAFRVFGLDHPTAARPYIAGLLDPCTNSKLAPNIPAEVLFDRRDDGLRLCNSWAGFHVLLNPDYSAQTQWRFVNRAIDEVENNRVPAVVLVCRNSTDTGYFQRLRPYPRVLLRRLSAQFKDYDKTPIGFGVAVFCIAKHRCRSGVFSGVWAVASRPLAAGRWRWKVAQGFGACKI